MTSFLDSPLPVAHVIVGGDSLRVVVDHDGSLAKPLKLPYTADGTPVKLDGRSDAVDPRANDHRELQCRNSN